MTPAPSNVGQTAQEIVPYVFPQSAAAFLGVDMPTVGVGESVWPVLSGTLDVHYPAENAAAAETTAHSRQNCSRLLVYRVRTYFRGKIRPDSPE